MERGREGREGKSRGDESQGAKKLRGHLLIFNKVYKNWGAREWPLEGRRPIGKCRAPLFSTLLRSGSSTLILKLRGFARFQNGSRWGAPRESRKQPEKLGKRRTPSADRRSLTFPTPELGARSLDSILPRPSNRGRCLISEILVDLTVG